MSKTYPTTELPVHENDALAAVPGLLKLDRETGRKFHDEKEKRLFWNGYHHGIPDVNLPELANAVGLNVEDIRTALKQAYKNQSDWEETVLG
ncbi:MAG: hypothetical protein AAB383_03990 [Patescibacteria group bacterium]